MIISPSLFGYKPTGNVLRTIRAPIEKRVGVVPRPGIDVNMDNGNASFTARFPSGRAVPVPTLGRAAALRGETPWDLLAAFADQWTTAASPSWFGFSLSASDPLVVPIGTAILASISITAAGVTGMTKDSADTPAGLTMRFSTIQEALSFTGSVITYFFPAAVAAGATWIES